jgi:hypothetical protein
VPIRFGTDGWRGVMADDFTFDNVRIVTQAVADLVHEEGRAGSPVPVGHDVRFLSRRFAEAAAAVLEGNGIPTILPECATTTPMVSCQVVAAAAPLGVVITASHNPAVWNGFKIKAAFGGSAPPELTGRIEALLGRRAPRVGHAPSRRHPFLPAYVPRLQAVVHLESIRRSPLVVVVDSMHGAGGRILEGSVQCLAYRGRAITVGNAAKANIIHDPTHTIYSAKRLIGRYFFSEEVRKAKAICSYKIVEGENHSVRIQVREEAFSLPEVGAMVLRELKSIAESRLGGPVTKSELLWSVSRQPLDTRNTAEA